MESYFFLKGGLSYHVVDISHTSVFNRLLSRPWVLGNDVVEVKCQQHFAEACPSAALK